MTVLSIREIYDAARSAGFDEHEAVTWTAIALAESGGRTGALNTKGEHSVGLWQINLAADSGRARYGDLHDPTNNARAAYDISHHGSDMRPWTTTHTAHRDAPSYRRFLERVEEEVGVQGDPRGVPGYGSQLPPPMRYDASYDRIDPGAPLAGSAGSVPSPESTADADADGLTDAFEKLAGTDHEKTDTDDDGLTDAYEAGVSHTDPLTPDTDHDQTPDATELAAGTDAGRLPGNAGVVGTGALAENVRDGVKDTDHDGLSNHAEKVLRTDRKNADTDHDGLTDGQELALHTDPRTADTDHDGLTDGTEVDHSTNPLGATTLGAPLGSDVTGGSGSPLGGPALAAPAGPHGSSLADVLDHD